MPDQKQTPPSKADTKDAKDSQSQDSQKDGDKAEGGGAEEPEAVKFSPEEEAELLAESNTHKSEANTLFNGGSYTEALAAYADATSSCPNYLDYELAVLHSNISACHLKLQEWKDAITSATTALTKLDRASAQLADEEARVEAEAAAHAKEEDEIEDEIVSPGAREAAPPASKEEDVDPAAEARAKRRDDVQRIRYKALMRRARARSEEGGWSNLAGAEEDYKALAAMPAGVVTPGDRKIVTAQLRSLPARVKEAQERETAEMWGKLKDLGNGILKPFGLSTENFAMQQDPKTGGYSMNFKSD